MQVQVNASVSSMKFMVHINHVVRQEKKWSYKATNEKSSSLSSCYGVRRGIYALAECLSVSLLLNQLYLTAVNPHISVLRVLEFILFWDGRKVFRFPPSTN